MKKRSLPGPVRNRRGVAVVEFAISLPLITLILVGSIDMGQAIYVSQVVNEASREAARQAARRETASESAVNARVKSFIHANSVGMANATVNVSFSDNSGKAIANGDLSSIQPGSPMTVQVSLSYDSVRWISGLPILNGRQITTQTVMRRE